jgi:hypothetical protein
MDSLLVGMLALLAKLASENSLPSVMSSAASSLWKSFRADLDQRSGEGEKVIAISPEW